MAGYLEYKIPADDLPIELELSKIESMSIEPVMSLDDMNVSHLRHILRVKCLFTAVNPDTFYTDLRNLEKVLTTPRGRLIIASDASKTDILHDINSLSTGLRPDIEGGPKPRSLVIDEFIKGIAAHITWTVEYNTIPCPISVDDLPDILSRHHSVSFGYSDDGRLTRTIDGEVRIPDRVKTDVYEKNVQNAQGAAYFHVPRGWRRTSANLGISPNGLVLQFQYVDEELELGWHDLAASMELDWSERLSLTPATLEFTFTFRVKGRRGILKRQIIKDIVVPIANDLIAKHSATKLFPGAAEWNEDLLTNEVSGSIRWLGVPFDGTRGNLGSLELSYLPPTQQFGLDLKELKRISPNPVEINGETTNFDSVLLADLEHRKRWETLPLLTRLLVKDVCDRSRLDPADDYEEEDEGDDTVYIKLHEEEGRPEPESSNEEVGEDDRLPYLQDEPFAPGNYIVDEEVMQISIDYHTEVIGNQNIVNINENGELELTPEKSQRLYQNKVPTMVVKVVGRAVRIDEMAAARAIPTILEPSEGQNDDKGGDVEIKLVPQKVKVTHFGPHIGPGGRFATYGVQWSYICTRDLDTKFFEIDSETQLTKLRIPKHKTRLSALFTEDAMAKLQWNETHPV